MNCGIFIKSSAFAILFFLVPTIVNANGYIQKDTADACVGQSEGKVTANYVLPYCLESQE